MPDKNSDPLITSVVNTQINVSVTFVCSNGISLIKLAKHSRLLFISDRPGSVVCKRFCFIDLLF